MLFLLIKERTPCRVNKSNVWYEYCVISCAKKSSSLLAQSIAFAGTITNGEHVDGNQGSRKKIMQNNQGDRKMIKELIRCLLLLGLCTLLLAGCSIPSIQGNNPPVRITPLTLPPATTSPTSLPSSTDWTTYHRNNSRNGLVENAPDPHQLTRAWSIHLDGAVYGEPLVVGGRLIVATEGDSLYALDVHTGKVQWHTNVGSPVPLSTLPCGNIDPLGITGTPVYDPATALVFAVAEISGPAHIMFGVD